MPISKKKKENSQPPLRNEGVNIGVPGDVSVNRPALAGRLSSALQGIFPYLKIGEYMEFSFETVVIPKKNSFHAGQTRTGRLYQYRSTKAKTSEAGIQWEAMQQRQKQKATPANGSVLVYSVFRKTGADCIGLMETVLDALQGVAYKNDKQAFASMCTWDSNVLLPNETAWVLVIQAEFKNRI